MSDNQYTFENNEAEDLDKKYTSNYQINIIRSDSITKNNNKKSHEPFYLQNIEEVGSASPRSNLRSISCISPRIHSKENVDFYKMSQKELEIDQLITNKLKSKLGFDDLIKDPQISKFIKK